MIGGFRPPGPPLPPDIIKLTRAEARAELRAAGQAADAVGGMDAMHDLGRKIQRYYRWTANCLNLQWDRIGDWMH
ncbi:hypothetical protein [Oleomonas cavernae]|nr:hypothetical protein [Oleomonas cavernae]